MSNIIERSFKANLKIMTFLGILPSKKNYTLAKIWSVVLYITLLVLPTLLSSIKLFLADTKSETLQLNFAVIYIAEETGAMFKLIPLFKNGRRFDKCVNYFSHPRFKPTNFEEKKIVDECINVCKRIGNIYLYGVALVIFFWNLQAVISEGNTLTLDIWLPFNAPNSTMYYYTMLILFVPVLIYDAYATSFVDPLIGSLAYHATCQLKILKYKLQNLDEGINAKLEDNYIMSFEKMHKNLKRCICLYDDILNFVEEFENCISWPVFCQIAASIFVLCFSCVGIIHSSSGTLGTVVNIFCMCTTLFQTFCYCYFGTLLYNENSDLPNAIYMGRWYQYDTRIRKVLIIIMERSKRPMVLTSGKIVKLTLETFTSLLNTSYSLIAVFKNYG